jgi:hypothetical protein
VAALAEGGTVSEEAASAEIASLIAGHAKAVEDLCARRDSRAALTPLAPSTLPLAPCRRGQWWPPFASVRVHRRAPSALRPAAVSDARWRVYVPPRPLAGPLLGWPSFPPWRSWNGCRRKPARSRGEGERAASHGRLSCGERGGRRRFSAA